MFMKMTFSVHQTLGRYPACEKISAGKGLVTFPYKHFLSPSTDGFLNWLSRVSQVVYSPAREDVFIAFSFYYH